MSIDDKRRSGRTTRQIDDIIQVLFSNQEAFISPHYFYGIEEKRNRDRESERMLRIILNRLKLEHHIYGESVKVDKNKWSIKLVGVTASYEAKKE